MHGPDNCTLQNKVRPNKLFFVTIYGYFILVFHNYFTMTNDVKVKQPFKNNSP